MLSLLVELKHSVITENFGPLLKGQIWGVFRGSSLWLAGYLIQACRACRVYSYVCMWVCEYMDIQYVCVGTSASLALRSVPLSQHTRFHDSNSRVCVCITVYRGLITFRLKNHTHSAMLKTVSIACIVLWVKASILCIPSFNLICPHWIRWQKTHGREDLILDGDVFDEKQQRD